MPVVFVLFTWYVTMSSLVYCNSRQSSHTDLKLLLVAGGFELSASNRVVYLGLWGSWYVSHVSLTGRFVLTC